jgi:hypothetical protein
MMKVQRQLRPQRAASKLVTFTTKLDEGMVTRRIGQQEIGDFDLCRLISSCASVVEEE